MPLNGFRKKKGFCLHYLRQDDNGIEQGEDVVVCLSGRVDKDVHTVADASGVDL